MATTTAHRYYIDVDGAKEGPLELVMLMRRIRMGKLLAASSVYMDDAPAPVPAASLSELAIFFAKPEAVAATREKAAFSVASLITEGWRFVRAHSIITVPSGAIALLYLLIAITLTPMLGAVAGSGAAWIMHTLLVFLLLPFVLRMQRLQPLSASYINGSYIPALPRLTLAALTLSLMSIGGFTLLLVPALMVSIYYAFVPFLLVERKLTLIEAMVASRLLVWKNKRYQPVLALLWILYMVSLLLAIPAPLTIPMYAAALAKIYDEFVA